MYNSIIISLTMFTLLFVACITDNDSDQNHSYKSFCEGVESDNFEMVGKNIDLYLSTLDNDYDENDPDFGHGQNFNHINTWLDSFDCVADVILVGGFIETYPLQKEFVIDFLVDQDTVTKTLDISVFTTLTFVRFHQ